MQNISILPDTFDEAIDLLKSMLGPEVDTIKKLNEDQFVSRCHFDLGMMIRNSWNLWWHKNHSYKEWGPDQPKLNAWFNSIGIVHADDMSSILFKSLHRNLNGLDYELDKQVNVFKLHWMSHGYPDGIPSVDNV